MSAPVEVMETQALATSSEVVCDVARTLRLEPASRPGCATVSILRNALAVPIAALVDQGGSLREDRRTIERVKASDPELPIIFISRTTTSRHETAIRRLGIHYFLAHPIEKDELRLVLEVLARTSLSAASCERRESSMHEEEGGHEDGRA